MKKLLICAAMVNTSLINAQDEAQLRWLIQGVPDPTAIEAHDGSGSYVFSTGKGIAIWQSPDREPWQRTGRVFSDDVPLWAKKLIPKADSVWAPDIHFHNGLYYLYYSVSTFGSQRSVIGLAVNTTLDPKKPEYKWEDRGMVLESFPEKNDYNAIDPAAFHTDDGSYLVWGSYWTGIKGTRLNPKTGKPDSSQPKTISLAARESTGPTAIEAPYVIRHEGMFYLFVSWDFCCAQENSTYKILVGRSKSPLGPFVDDNGRKMTEGGGRLVLMSDNRWRGPGHNSVLQTANGDLLVFHVIDARNPQSGRVLGQRKIDWQHGWPVVAEGPASNTKADSISVVGRWKHVVNGRDRYDIFFEPTGEITGTKGRADWELRNHRLKMIWHDPQAPDGKWIDEVVLSADGKSYSGRNQNGTTIRGDIVR